MAQNNGGNLLIRRVSAKASVVHGLQWETLVGQNLDKQSLKQARSHKATHLVRAGRHSSAFGYARLSAKDRKARGIRYYSAAAIFAQAHPQGVYWHCRDMPDDTVWVVAVQDGVVVSGTDIICSHDEAEGVHQALLERYDHIVQIEHEEGSDDSLHYLNERTQMVSTKSGIEGVPLPALIGGGALLCFVLVDMGWDAYTKHKRNQERARLAQSYVDPESAWREQLGNWERNTQLVGQQSLLQAFDSLASIPLNVGSWNLQSAGCESGATGWTCHAVYDRLTGTNMSFKHAAPTEWSVSWTGLQTARGSWEVANSPTIPMVRSSLPTVEEVSTGYISQLQAVMTSFETLKLDPAVGVDIPTPEFVDSNGVPQSIPHPGTNDPSIALPKVQSFLITAPMRSILAFPAESNFHFDSLHVQYKPQASSSLSRSMITATVKGKYYVQ